jgi:purine-binding chemotaxis protein CheW
VSVEGGSGAAVGSSAGASWEDLARAAGSGGGDEDASSEEVHQLLTFDLAGAAYAVPVESVREIVRIRPITPVPRVTADIQGVIALRGEIIQVVDLRRRLSLPPQKPSRRSRIVVVHLEDGRVAGVLVDGVREVLRVGAEAIGPPAGGDCLAVEALCTRGDEFVSLIALDRILEVDES